MNTATLTQPTVLVNPKIEVKNVKNFQGRDGYGLNATLYLNGKKIAFILDEGNGGEMRFEGDGKNIEEIKANRRIIEQLEEYAKTLPKEKIEGITGLTEEESWIQPDLALIVDKLCNEQEQKRVDALNAKRLSKKMLTCILVGIPNSDAYRIWNFKRLLSTIPVAILQKHIDEKIIPSLKQGEKVLNTNLKSLGIKY